MFLVSSCTQPTHFPHAPVILPDANHILEDAQTEAFVHALASYLPASADRLQQFRVAQQQDSTCSQLITFCKQGWPSKSQITGDALQYWPVRGELSLHDDLLIRGHCIVIPRSLRQETLQKIHNGHQGIQRYRLRVSTSVWWPGISQQVEQVIKSCPECAKASVPHVQPMIASPLPSHPWEKVASDLFQLNGKTYLLVADYFLWYMEVQTLATTTSASVIRALKAIFGRHGVPSVLVSDNGPQYNSIEMQAFAALYNFRHITSSPHYPQRNGLAERMVKTAKSLPLLPRSYMVEASSGIVRRNQSHLLPKPGEGPSSTVPTEPQQRTIATRSRTGTHILKEGRCGILVDINTYMLLSPYCYLI